MKKRQQAEYLFLVRKFEYPVDTFEFGDDIAVSQWNALWCAGRAACVHQDGEIVPFCGWRFCFETVRKICRGPIFEPLIAVGWFTKTPNYRRDLTAEFFLNLRNAFGLVGRKKRDLRFRIVEEVFDSFDLAVWIERDDHGP